MVGSTREEAKFTYLFNNVIPTLRFPDGESKHDDVGFQVQSRAGGFVRLIPCDWSYLQDCRLALVNVKSTVCRPCKVSLSSLFSGPSKKNNSNLAPEFAGSLV